MKHKGIFKRLSLLTLLLIAGFTSAMAQSLYMEGFKINAGDTKTVTVALATDGYDIYGLQTDIVLSNGLYLDGDPVAVEGAMADPNPSISCKWMDNKTIRVVMLSLDGKVFMPGNTNVIQFNVGCTENFVGGTIKLTNSRLTISNYGDEVYVSNFSAKITTDQEVQIPEGVWGDIPEPQGLEFVDEISFDGSWYYLYNPEGKRFFASGNEWNTRASLAQFGYPVWFQEATEDDAPEGSYELWNYVDNPDRYDVTGEHNVFTDDGGSTWVDHASQSNYSWFVTPAGDGYYRLQNAMLIQYNPDYEGRYLGWNGTSDNRLYMIYPEEGHAVNWRFVTYDSYQNFISSEEYYEYSQLAENGALGQRLYELLVDAKELDINIVRWLEVYMNTDSSYGELQSAISEISTYISYKIRLRDAVEMAAEVRVDVSEYQGVYDNPEAELEEMENAYYNVQDAIDVMNNFLNLVEKSREMLTMPDFQGLDATQELADYLNGELAKLLEATMTREEIYMATETIKNLREIMIEESKGVVYDGKDVTYLIENPGFDDDWNIDSGSAEGWNIDNYSGRTLTRGPLGQNNKDLMENALGYMNYCFEAWHNYNWDVWQELTNLPVGMYELQVQGYVRCEVPGYTRGDDINPNYPSPVYLYMNNALSSFPSVYSESPADYGKEMVEVETWYQEEVNDKPYPNSMGGAAQCFGWGMYKTTAYGLIAREGDIFRIGVKMNKNQDWWCIFDNFKLTYRTPTAEIVQPILETELAKLDLSRPMGKDIYELISNLKTTAQNAIDAQDGQVMFNVLTQAYDLNANYLESVALFVELQRAVDTFVEAINNSENQDAINQADALAGEIYNGINNHTIYDWQVYEYIDQMNNLYTALALPADWASASDKNPIDLTAVIKNPSFENEWGESTDEGWMNPGNLGNDDTQRSALAMEFWQTEFNMYQVIQGLPEGTYMISVDAWERVGDNYDNYYYWLEDNRYTNSYLYGMNGDGKVYNARIANMMKAAPTEDPGMEGIYEYGLDGNIYYLPNTLVGGKGLIDLNPGAYTNKVIVNVGPDGFLRIGVKRNYYGSNSWTVLDDFRLTYFGKESSKQPGEVIDIDLASVIKEANDLLGMYMQTSLQTELQQLVDTYKDATDAAEMEEGYQLLTNCISRVRENINAYANLAEVISAVKQRLANGQNMDEDVVAEATAFVATAEAAYVAREINTRVANEYANKLYNLLDQLYAVFATVTIEIPGTLADTLYSVAGDPWNLQGLKVKGNINDDDLYFIRDLYNLRLLDLAGTNLEKMPNWIFEYRDNLQKVELPATLLFMGYGAFDGCYNLQSLTLHAAVPPYGYDRATWSWGYNLYVPAVSVQAYQNNELWNNWNIQGIDELPEKYHAITDFQITWPETQINDSVQYKPDMRIGQYNLGGNYDYTYGAVTVNSDKNNTVSLGQFTIVYDPNIELTRRFEWGYSDYSGNGSLVNYAENMRADNVTVDYWVRRDRWTFFSLPFDAQVSEIGLNFENTPFVIRKYDAAARAAGNMNETWVNMTADSVLHAGEGYILQSTAMDYDEEYRNYNGFFFKAMQTTNKNNIFVSDDVEVPLKQFASEFAHNQNWNLIGNPYPCYYNIQGMQTNAPITVWNHYYQSYEAYSPLDDIYVLNPGEAFFVQRPVNESSIVFIEEGRQARRDQVNYDLVAGARSAVKAANRYVFNITISDGETTDRTRIVLNEEAKAGYEQDKDASKFMSLNDEVAQIYSVADAKYAINERPMANGEVKLGVHFGKQGTYTIALNTKVDAEVVLVDLLTGKEIRLDGSEGYTFEANEGDTEDRFVVRFAGGQLTGIQTIANGNSDNEKYYNLNGMQIEQPKKGLYLKNGKKVVVK